jgi:hypothetical protein
MNNQLGIDSAKRELACVAEATGRVDQEEAAHPPRRAMPTVPTGAVLQLTCSF